MPRNDEYEYAEDYLDDTYRPEDNEDLQFDELTAKEQEQVLRDMFFKGTNTPAQSAKDMRLGLDRPYGQGRGRGRINLRGHIHHIIRDTSNPNPKFRGRILKWLD
jgi:hypothetical protein